MKKLISTFAERLMLLCMAVFISSLAMTGCSDDELPFVELSENEVFLESVDGVHSVNVRSNIKWDVVCPGNWCRLVSVNQQQYTKSFQIMYDVNSSAVERQTSIAVNYAGGSKMLLIRQKGSDISLSVSEDSVSFYKNGESHKIMVYANHDWDVNSSKDWCTLSQITGSGDGEFNIEVTDNDSGAERSALVIVSSKYDNTTVTQKITVTQGTTKSEIIVTPAEKIVGSAAESINATILTAAGWKASADSKWISLDKTSGSGDATLRITVADNETGEERSGVVSIYTDGENRQVRTVKIKQGTAEYHLEVPTTEFLLTKAKGELAVRYLLTGADCAVSASTDANWITLKNTANGYMIFNIQENTSDERRSADVAIFTAGQSGEPIVRHITVWQSPTVYELDILFDDLDLDPKGETRILDMVTSQTPVTVKSDKSWCVVTADGNNETVTLNAQANLTGKTRTATITVEITLSSGNKISKAYTVTQESIDLTFNFEQAEYKGISYLGTTIRPQLKSAGEWTLKEPGNIPKWLNIDPIAGDGDTYLSVSVKPNTTLLERNYHAIFVNTFLGVEAMLTISQEKTANSMLSDYKYLGYGYDTHGEYAYDSYVKAAVLDWEKLIDNEYIIDVVSPNVTDEWHVYGQGIQQYQENMSAQASLGGSVMGFGASVSSSFSSSLFSVAEQEYSTWKHTSQKSILQIDGGLTANDLKSCLTDGFKSDINNSSVSTTTLIKRYGTHVITGLILGGCMDFSMTANRVYMEESTEWGVAVKTGFSIASVGSAEAGAGFNSYESISNSSKDFSTTLVVRGGESQFGSQKPNDASMYTSWLASLNDYSKWVMVDFAGSQLIPLWDFADDSGRRNEIEQAVIKYLAQDGFPEAVQTYKYLQLNTESFRFLGDDSGETAEVYYKLYLDMDGSGYGNVWKEEEDVDISTEGNGVLERTYAGSVVVHNIYEPKTVRIKVTGYESDVTENSHFMGEMVFTYNPSNQTWTAKETATGRTFSYAYGKPTRLFGFASKDNYSEYTGTTTEHIEFTFVLDWRNSR